jgi:putative transposon-encoded protein
MVRQIRCLTKSIPIFRKFAEMPNGKKEKSDQNVNAETELGKVKFEVYGQEMVEKVVRLSGNSGRVYLPPDWVGSRVKIIRID